MREDPRKQNDRVVVTCLSGLTRLPERRITHRRWLYLGKDVKGKSRVESLLGPENRWQCGEKLRQAAKNLRQPFLDFVAEVGVHQRDRISWWSSRFSWKMWTNSDLFLLLCYLCVAQEVIQEALRRRIGLLLVVEDRWLLHQLKENCAGLRPLVGFAHAGWLGWEKCQAIFSGVLKRVWWLWTMLRNYVRQRRAWPGGKPHSPSTPTAAIFSYPLTSCLLNGGGWEDPYLPGLDLVLQKLGYEVVRFSPPDTAGFEYELAKRYAYFRPLILWATVAGMWRSLRAVWWPRWPERLSVNGLLVRRLVEREWWLEVGRSSLCGFRIHYECMREMLRQGEWRWIVLPYENQPWEKMITLCAQERGVRVAGLQTAILSRYYLPYFLGEGEAQRVPLPDVIFTSGPYAHRVLVEGGNPPERLHMCGNVRYPHLTNRATGGLSQIPNPASRSEILVALPIDPHMSEHLLAAIRRAFPTGGVEEGLRFHIRSHPMFPVKREEIGFPAAIVPSNFQDLTETLPAFGLVIFCGSTVGFEAIAAGRAVLRYRSELLLDVDEVYDDNIPTCSDDDLHEVLLGLVQDGERTWAPGHTDRMAPPLFAPFDREKLEEALGGKLPGERRG